MSFYRVVGKRALDVALAVTGMVTLAPVFILVAIMIKVDDGGPVLFTQRRIGRYGREFTILKFRSMHVETGDIPSGELQVATITRTGRVIRRTNIDELPQLLNVLKGDMSIVGPRPCLRSQTNVVAARRANDALKLRPGLTGWAQVNAFDRMAASQKSRLDGEYAEMLSIAADAKIIGRTVGYLLRPPPTY